MVVETPAAAEAAIEKLAKKSNSVDPIKALAAKLAKKKHLKCYNAAHGNANGNFTSAQLHAP